MRLQHIKRHKMESFLVDAFCKNESAIDFLVYYYHGDTNTAFPLKLASFLVTQHAFMIEFFLSYFLIYANKLLRNRGNGISFHFILNLTQASSLRFDMENMEILGFQFEPYQGAST